MKLKLTLSINGRDSVLSVDGLSPKEARKFVFGTGPQIAVKELKDTMVVSKRVGRPTKQKVITGLPWKREEDALLVRHLNKKISRVKRLSVLLRRHTPASIQARFYAFKCVLRLGEAALTNKRMLNQLPVNIINWLLSLNSQLTDAHRNTNNAHPRSGVENVTTPTMTANLPVVVSRVE